MQLRGKTIFYNTVIHKPKEHDTLPASRVFGVDTESWYSLQLGELHTGLLGLSSSCTDDLYTIEPGENLFDRLMELPFPLYADTMKMSKRESATRRRKKQDGTFASGRANLSSILLVFYNLEYDISRLFAKDSAFFNLARINEEATTCREGSYEIENVHMQLTGSAPHFTLIVRKSDQVLKVHGLDLWGYLKQGLASSAKAMGVIEKLEIEKDFFNLTYEEITEEQWLEIKEYARRDPKTTRETYLKLLEFLTEFSPFVVTAKGILPPSAPGAAARIAFSGLTSEKLNQSPEYAVKIALESYAGGLVFSRVRGSVSNLLVGDRTSAYPTMMQLLPDPEKVGYAYKTNFKVVDLYGKIGFVRATFDNHAKDVPFITTFNGDISNHATGHYDKQPISIYELLAGVECEQFTNVIIHECVFLVFGDEAKKSGIFYDFVDFFFRVKNENEKGSALYLLAKLLMNALYGKLIETRNPDMMILGTSLRRLKFPISLKEKLKKDKGYRRDFFQALTDGEEKFLMFVETIKPCRKEKMITLEAIVKEQTLTAGNYFFPFYASLITAGQRAWTAIYAHHVNAILADTDSAFTLLSEEQFHDAIGRADRITQKIGVGRCRIGKELGDIDIESKNASGFIAGIKQYYLEDAKGNQKIAHHAIQKADCENQKEHFKQAIKNLSEDKPYTYTTKRSPVRLRTALYRKKDFGLFESRENHVIPKDDLRLKRTKKVGTLVYYQWKDKT